MNSNIRPTDNYEYDDAININNDGGEVIIPTLMFLIIACVIGQACFQIHMYYPHWFTIDIEAAKYDDDDDITVETIIKKQDEHDEFYKSKNNLDMFTNDMADEASEPFTPIPKTIRMSRRNSM
jgi:hypothetical protein